MKIQIRYGVFFAFVLSTAVLVAQGPSATSSGNTRAVGTVQSATGNSLVLKTDAGAEVTVTVQDTSRILRSEPGQKSLKEATPIQLSDIQAGDRTLASGVASPDGKSIAATTVVVMKQGDIASKQEKERQDWQHRGVGGIVSAVGAANNTVTISTMAMMQKKEVTVRVSPNTVIRRYAPDSVKFDDAKKSTLAEIHPGDQLRARGNRNPEGTEVTADEIVSGAFRSVAGTVQSIDKAKQQLTVMDLATKKPVTIAIGGESQMHKLPEMMAQRIAMRLKGTAESGGNANAQGGAQHQGPAAGGPEMRGGMGGNGHGSGNGDVLQLILSRAPVVQLSDLQKGDAVMFVATQGSDQAPPTAITLLAGVEPILSATTKGGDATTILSPWNLGGNSGGDASAAQ
jgi:transcription antitermination factor NusG